MPMVIQLIIAKRLSARLLIMQCGQFAFVGMYVCRYRIAGNFRWVQIFAIFADRPASAKIKTAKKCTRMEL